MENNTKSYASALIRYARARQGIRSSSAENFDPAVLIKSALPPDISIQVSSDLPKLICGDSVFDENSLQFATCVELVRTLGGTLSHEQINENVEVVSLILPFNKFMED
ncbi:MAG: hypothetical protein EBU13_10175 [Synechococcaceae bacterium WB5_2A_257]|nr:hypothetical protein [Synechococcaceae bacterium WB5_2A_257]